MYFGEIDWRAVALEFICWVHFQPLPWKWFSNVIPQTEIVLYLKSSHRIIPSHCCSDSRWIYCWSSSCSWLSWPLRIWALSQRRLKLVPALTLHRRFITSEGLSGFEDHPLFWNYFCVLSNKRSGWDSQFRVTFWFIKFMDSLKVSYMLSSLTLHLSSQLLKWFMGLSCKL